MGIKNRGCKAVQRAFCRTSSLSTDNSSFSPALVFLVNKIKMQ